MVISQLYSKYSSRWFTFQEFKECFNLSKPQSNEILGLLIQLDIVLVKQVSSEVNKYRLSENKVKEYTDVSE